MRRVQKKLLVLTGLLLSGINSAWANSITTILNESNQIKPINKYLSQENREILYELNFPEIDDLLLIFCTYKVHQSVTQ